MRHYPETFYIQCSSIPVGNVDNPTIVEIRRFRQIYGASPRIIKLLWELLYPDLPKTARPHGLLHALRFLKTYATEEVSAQAENCDEKTFRKNTWLFVPMLSQLNLVSFFESLQSIV